MDDREALDALVLTRRRLLAALPAAAVLGLWPARSLAALSRAPAGKQHPDPRPGITAANVLPPERYAGKKRVEATFARVREIPEVMDGLHCYCECEQSMGHRSLLSCFESEQAIGCYACREEADLAYKLHKAGKTLAEIRAGVDREFA